jgi:hypothetical protein
MNTKEKKITQKEMKIKIKRQNGTKYERKKTKLSLELMAQK